MQDNNKLSSTIQSIMNKKNSGLNIVDIAKWGSAELSTLDDIAGKLPSKALGILGKLLKSVLRLQLFLWMLFLLQKHILKV